MGKYVTVNVTREQLATIEFVRKLLEENKQGPYGGYGGSVSKGEAIEYACREVSQELFRKVEQEKQNKRAIAAEARRNNNINITPGVSRR